MFKKKFVAELLFVILYMGCSSTAEDVYHTQSVLSLKPNMELREESLFGFSVAYLKDEEPRLIVGAPRADRIGQIQECTLEENNSSCLPVNIPKDIDFGLSTEHGVWLGASVTAGSSFYAVCAPRCFDIYKTKSNSKWNERNGTFGLCLRGRPGEPLQPLLRMKTNDREESAQYQKLFETLVDGLGWSSSVTRNDNLIVGGPPMGKGAAVVYFSPLDLTKTPSLLTKNYIAKYNLGYSVTSGNYFSDNVNDELLAVSSTYGFDGTGKVLLMNKNRTVVTEILGKRSNLGAMFGAALCTANLEGDSHAELIVGAPAFTTGAHYVDVGALYVYKREGMSMIFLNMINGTNTGDYFGYAMVNIGDMDRDGYDDVAVSAPGVDGGTGAVYVYSSRALTGRRAPSPLQRLTPTVGLRGFGRALAALADYDDNGCKELAVGAADSNRVLVYRCVPTLDVELQPYFPNLRTLDVNATAFTFKSCMFITYPEKPIVIKAAVKVRVEIIHRAARLADSPGGASEYIRLLKASSTTSRKYSDCTSLKVDTDKNGDFSEMLQYKISLVQMDNPHLYTDFNVSRVLIPSQSVQGNLPAARGCKLNGCQPQLRLDLYWSMQDTYVVGSTKRENVVLSVSNAGDTSYGACVRIRVRGVSVWSPPAQCDAHVQTGRYTCNLHAPLYRNSEWNMGSLIFEMDHLLSEDRKISIEASLHEPCSRLETNHTAQLESRLIGDASKVTITGSIREYVLLTKNELQNKNETRLTQTYQIHNAGVTRWVGLFLTFELQRRSYIEYDSITILTESLETVECQIPSSKERKTKVEVKYVTCQVGDLRPKSTTLVYLQMRLVHKELESILDASNLTFSYKLYLPVQNYTRALSVSTIIWLRDEIIPWWLIFLGAILGFLLFILLIYVLYMMGFFGRKNKQKLDNLKREFHRRSMMSQSSRRAATGANAEENEPIVPETENIVINY